MRNLFKTIVCVAAAALMATACVKEQDFGREYADASEYISFYSFLSAEAGVSTKSVASTFTCEEEDWPLQAKKADTKAAPTTGLSGNAGLIGYSYDTWDEASTLPWTAYFYNTEYSFSNERLSATGTPVQWIRSTEDYLKVFAYAPMSFVDGAAATLSASSATGTPTITYTVPSDPAEQVDLIGATATVAGDYKNSIPLSFDHALTAVRFKIGYACTVKSVSLQGVKESGVYAIGGGWSSLSGDATYTFTFNGGSGTAFAADAFLNDDANTLMLLPQDLTASSQIVLVYDDGEEHTATFSLKGMSWPAGKRVTYTLQKNEIEYIYFDLAAGAVSISSSTYSGAVFANGNNTPQAVSGTHKTSNKYYVYQSSTNSESAGYYGITGFLNGVNIVNSKFDGKVSDGKPVTLPEYQEMRTADNGVTWDLGGSSGITWREYITNHRQSEDLIEFWEYDNHPVKTTQKRTGTVNQISVNASVDITVDNVWCSGNYSKPFSFHGSTNLRLKGDNFVAKVVASSGGYFYITSFNGDGSEDGSLTVTPLTRTFESGVPHPQCAIQFANSGAPDKMAIKGGTIYAATTLARDRAYRWTSGGICPSSAGAGNLLISGGAVTAVAHSLGAAIGGGGGMIGQAAQGHIIISGGRTYAYQLGYTTNTLKDDTSVGDRGITGVYQDYTFPVATTAIGGGSTMSGNPTAEASEKTVVEIIGDAYVYAESVGGVAIGGGSSGGLRGGNAEVKIGETGNPTVIAKSVSGYIGNPLPNGQNHYVEAGTAIGGGNGGDENHKVVNAEWKSYPTDEADGGFGKVIISGGVVYTGSIGGGNAGKVGTAPDIIRRKLGSADISVSGGTIQGQFVMQAGAATAPTFTMSGGTINNSDLSESSGFYRIKEDGGSVFIGGGTNPGSFTMTGGIIRNSSATNGGAVYQEGGTFSMSGGSIESSSATSGGALYVSGGTVSMSGGAIQQCSSTSHGGAMYMAGGSVTISGGDINNNSASGTGADGGGIYISKGSFTMPALGTGLIRNNYAKNDGGGVYITSEDDNVTVNVLSGSITGNTSDYRGGGLCVLPGGGYAANITLGIVDQGTLNPAISGNESALSGGGLYAEGANANVSIYSGNIRGNNVSAYVVNNDIANEGGLVTLYGGDVDYRTVTFNANGGVGADQTQKIVTATNTHLQVPAAAQAFTKADHNLTGWNTAANGSGTSFAVNDTRVMNISENITLYAQWTAD